MKILLIGPTALDSQGRPIKQRRLHLPGLTLPMLAAVTPPHVRLRLVSETVEDIPVDEHWDLVGLTGMGSGIVRAWQIADQFRERGVKVVIGGIAASLGKPEWTLQHADALVIGEAEELWPQVIGDFEAGRLQPIYRMTRRPAIDRLPVPRYELMNKAKLGFWRPVQATRGCPFTCNYCSITSFFEGGYRKRPVDQIVRDVRAAKRHGTRAGRFCGYRGRLHRARRWHQHHARNYGGDSNRQLIRRDSRAGAAVREQSSLSHRRASLHAQAG